MSRFVKELDRVLRTNFCRNYMLPTRANHILSFPITSLFCSNLGNRSAENISSNQVFPTLESFPQTLRSDESGHYPAQWLFRVQCFERLYQNNQSPRLNLPNLQRRTTQIFDTDRSIKPRTFCDLPRVTGITIRSPRFCHAYTTFAHKLNPEPSKYAKSSKPLSAFSVNSAKSCRANSFSSSSARFHNPNLILFQI